MPRLICLIASVFTSLFFLIASPTQAQDSLVVTFQTTPLFSITDGLWFPGRGLTKTFTVENLGSDEITLALMPENIQGEGGFYNLTVTSGGEVFYDGSLEGFLGGGASSLGNLKAGQAREFEVVLKLSDDAPPEVSGSLVVFDLVVEGTSVGDAQATPSAKAAVSSPDYAENNDKIDSSEGSSNGLVLTEGEVTGPVIAFSAAKRWGDRLEDSSQKILGETSPEPSAQSTPQGEEYSWLDILLQNKPNFRLLLVEEIILLVGIGYFIKKSGFLKIFDKRG